MPVLGRLIRYFAARSVHALLGAGCLLTTSVGWAAALSFERTMTESGVSVAETNSITQDSRGFIWIGGSNGLARYDTKQYQFYSHDPTNPESLSHSFVWDLLEDSRGRLWVATTRGLNRYQPETETFVRYLSSDDERGLIDNDVYTLFEDRQGRIWVGTRHGLARLREEGGFDHFVHRAGDPRTLSDSNITAIYQDSHGTLWVGTARGLNRFNPEDETFSRFEYRDKALFDPGQSIRDIIEDAAGQLWVATDVGLYRFDSAGDAKHYTHAPDAPNSLSDNRVWSLTIDDREQMWVATDHGGLNRYRSESDDFIHFRHDPYDATSLASDQVRELFQDNAGDYWVALFPSGVDYANSTSAAFSVYRHDPEQQPSLNHDAVLSISAGPDDRIWIGSEGGLNLYDPETRRFKAYRKQPDDPHSLGANAVLAAARDRDGRYWFGTWSGGLMLYRPESDDFLRFQPDGDNTDSLSSAYIWSLLGDSKGYLWIGTESGDLDRYDPATGKFQHFTPTPGDPNKLSGGFIRSIVEDQAGTIWVATINGLNRYNAHDGTFTSFQHRDGDMSTIPHNSVAAIFEDAQRRLWVGTEGGLALLNRTTGTFRTYTKRDGLPNNSIMGLAQDGDGYLWINTLKGLSRFDPDGGAFTNYSKSNGLAGNIMNRPAIHFADNGQLMVGSTKGLTVFDPHDLQTNTFVPPVYLTGFNIFNQQVPIKPDSLLPKHVSFVDTLTLSYQQNMFSLEFAALNYRDADANQYVYRMEGFDQQWINAGAANSATYTNLNPGDYVFTVKGSNNNGVWNEQGRSIAIRVLPPPWQTWWAYSLYGALLLALVYLFVRSQRRKVEFEQQKVAQLRQLDKLKDEFLANTSHELRTPLNGIIGLSESLMDTDEPLSEKTRTYLHMIAGSGRRLSNLINDILDFSKIRNNGLALDLAATDFRSVCDAVCLMSAPLAEKKHIALLNHVPSGLPPVSADEDRLQQILYNLIGNAIKFTFTGHVKIYADYDEDYVSVYVEDTGIGISEADMESIFESFTQARGDAAREYEGTGLGLAVAKNLIELHGGSISVHSRLNRGSTFRFKLRRTLGEVESDPEKAAPRINTVLDVAADNDNEVVVTESPNAGGLQFHILVVDDDPVNRQVLIGQLSLHNYRVSEAVNGQEAVDAIKRDGSIDLVLLDVMMPRMTGYEAAVQIRALKPVHELPIIFITAKHLASDLVAGFVAGGNDFLIKPVCKNELLSRTKTHLLLLDVTRNLENMVEERTNNLQLAQNALMVVDNIVNMINRQSSLEGLTRILLKESAVLLNTSASGAFWLLDSTGGRFNLIASHGEQQLVDRLPTIIDPALLRYRSKGVRIMAPEQIAIVPDAARYLDSVLVMTIETDHVVTGLLVFINGKGSGDFSEADREVFSRLEAHAVSAVSKAKLLETLKQQNQKLELASYTDQLTGLHNRRHLIRFISGDVAMSNRKYESARKSLACPTDADLMFILVDIDHFKEVNDRWGHQAGDRILKDFAAILQSVFRDSDHIVRWGGEEFLIVVRFFNRTCVDRLVERLRREVENAEFDIGNGQTLRRSCSIGYSCYPFYQDDIKAYSWEQVIEVADKCLYAAKKTSRNAWVGLYGKPDDGGHIPFQDLVRGMSDLLASSSVQVVSSCEDRNRLNWE